jgi:CRP-like cAMP-binding protein
MRNRLTTVQAITACDLAVIECQDFTTAAMDNNQKESVDDRFQFLSRATLLRHWDGVEMYRVASVMVREDFHKGTVLIHKGDVSKKLCFLMEGKIDVVVGLNQQQIQHVITTIKQNEVFNESGILTNMASLNATTGPLDRSENFAETCYAVAGSNVTLLSLPESHYNVIDQVTLDKLLIAFREKNLWRVSRLDNLRTESRNINKWKKKIALERQMEELKWVPPPRPKPQKKQTQIQSLDDIPQLLDPDIDPMLAISTCKNSREVRAVQQVVRESHRPKSARVASVRKYLNGASSSLRYTGPKRVTYSAFPPTTGSVARASTAPDNGHRRKDSTNLPDVNARSPMDLPDPSRVLLKSPSRHLMGSAHIPSAQSFCDTMSFAPSSPVPLPQRKR